jgi:hypothetical protein
MKATSDYWRAPFYLLEDRFQTWLVNAEDVKHLPSLGTGGQRVRRPQEGQGRHRARQPLPRPGPRRGCRRRRPHRHLPRRALPPDRRRRGKNRAIVAVGRSILVIAWALLSDEHAQFLDLGPDYHDSRTNPERKVRQHIRELQALGYTVTLNPAA